LGHYLSSLAINLNPEKVSNRFRTNKIHLLELELQTKAPKISEEKKEFLLKKFGTNFMTTRYYKKASKEWNKKVQKDADFLGVDDLMKKNVLQELGWETTAPGANPSIQHQIITPS